MKIVAYNTHQEQGSAWRGTTPAKARPTMSIYVARRCQGEAVWNRLITMRWYITAAITSTKTIKILSNIQKPGCPELLTAASALTTSFTIDLSIEFPFRASATHHFVLN